MNKNVYVFLGPIGSGKGTQAAFLGNLLGIPVLSTGFLLREEVKKNTELSEIISNLINKGSMVPDDIMKNVLVNRLENDDCKNGFILDGFPRSYEQVFILQDILDEANLNLDKVFVMNVDEDTIIKRITGRFMCKKCGAIYNKYFNNVKIEGRCDFCSSTEFETRTDDSNEGALKKRLADYNNNSKKIIEFYDKKGLIYLIDGLKNIEAINLDIKNILVKN